MRTLLAALTALMLFATPVVAGEFCNGYERGYITGYKQGSGYAVDPPTPPCPPKPPRGYADPESDFEFGYVLGYEDGKSDGSY
jgi:hypothetical protein